MVRQEIVTAVYEFIKNKPNCTKSDVERGVKVCTRLPIREALELLMSDKDGTEEPKIKFSRNTPRGFYKLYVNDKNTFNNITSMIDEMVQSIKLTTSMFLGPLTKRVFEHEREFLELTKLYQLDGYALVGYIAAGIDSFIQEREDNEALMFC